MALSREGQHRRAGSVTSPFSSWATRCSSRGSEEEEAERGREHSGRGAKKKSCRWANMCIMLKGQALVFIQKKQGYRSQALIHSTDIWRKETTVQSYNSHHLIFTGVMHIGSLKMVEMLTGMSVIMPLSSPRITSSHNTFLDSPTPHLS